MSRHLLDALREADSAIAEIKAAFGAPGDYGYETREGKALLLAYQKWALIREVVKKAEAEPPNE